MLSAAAAAAMTTASTRQPVAAWLRPPSSFTLLAAAADGRSWPDEETLGRVTLQDLVAGPCMGVAATTAVSATLSRLDSSVPCMGMEQPAAFLVPRMGVQPPAVTFPPRMCMGAQPPAAAPTGTAPPAAASPSAVRMMVDEEVVCRSRAAMESKVAECLQAGKRKRTHLGWGGEQ